jgi:flagellar biosynthesis component FlhA
MSDWTISEAYARQNHDVILLEISEALYQQFYTKSSFTMVIQDLRKEFLENFGVYMPPIRIKMKDLDPFTYRLFVRGRLVLEQSIEQKENTEVADAAVEAQFIQQVRRQLASSLDQCLTYQNTVQWLDQLKQHAPDLLKELAEKHITPGMIWHILRQLLKKQCPIAPLEQTLEWVLEYHLIHPYSGYIPPQWTHVHPDEIVDYVSKKIRQTKAPIAEPKSNVMHLRF